MYSLITCSLAAIAPPTSKFVAHSWSNFAKSAEHVASSWNFVFCTEKRIIKASFAFGAKIFVQRARKFKFSLILEPKFEFYRFWRQIFDFNRFWPQNMKLIDLDFGDKIWIFTVFPKIWIRSILAPVSFHRDQVLFPKSYSYLSIMRSLQYIVHLLNGLK